MMIVLIILWSGCLCLNCTNFYIYLIKLKKYRFVPSVLLYTGMLVTCCVVIAYFSQRINPTSRVNTNEPSWIYYSSNMRLFCIYAIIGFTALLVELVMMLKLMNKSSKQLAVSTRAWRTRSKL